MVFSSQVAERISAITITIALKQSFRTSKLHSSVKFPMLVVQCQDMNGFSLLVFSVNDGAINLRNFQISMISSLLLPCLINDCLFTL